MSYLPSTSFRTSWTKVVLAVVVDDDDVVVVVSVAVLIAVVLTRLLLDSLSSFVRKVRFLKRTKSGGKVEYWTGCNSESGLLKKIRQVYSLMPEYSHEISESSTLFTHS